MARGDGQASIVCEIVHGREYMVGFFDRRFEPAAIADRDAVEARREFAQDRVGPDLVAALRPFGTAGRRSAAAMVRPLDARDLETVQSRAIERGVGEVVGRTGVADDV